MVFQGFLGSFRGRTFWAAGAMWTMFCYLQQKRCMSFFLKFADWICHDLAHSRSLFCKWEAQRNRETILFDGKLEKRQHFVSMGVAPFEEDFHLLRVYIEGFLGVGFVPDSRTPQKAISLYTHTVIWAGYTRMQTWLETTEMCEIYVEFEEFPEPCFHRLGFRDHENQDDESNINQIDDERKTCQPTPFCQSLAGWIQHCTFVTFTFGIFFAYCFFSFFCLVWSNDLFDTSGQSRRCLSNFEWFSMVFFSKDFSHFLLPLPGCFRDFREHRFLFVSLRGCTWAQANSETLRGFLGFFHWRKPVSTSQLLLDVAFCFWHFLTLFHFTTWEVQKSNSSSAPGCAWSAAFPELGHHAWAVWAGLKTLTKKMHVQQPPFEAMI